MSFVLWLFHTVDNLIFFFKFALYFIYIVREMLTLVINFLLEFFEVQQFCTTKNNTRR